LTTETKQPQHQKTQRIEAYDVARAFAILGMIIVNFKIVMDSNEAGSDTLIFLTSLLEGRAAALFVVLAGVSLSLLSRRALASSDPVFRRSTQKGILKRSVFLLVFGLILVPIWPADILHFYSLYLAFGAVMLFVSDRRLLLAAVGIICIFPVLFILFDYSIGWDWDTLTMTDFWTVNGITRHLFFNGFHPFFPWAGFLMIGMWLGRQSVQEAQFRRRLLSISLVTLVIAEVSSAVLVTQATPSMGIELAESFFGRAVIPPTIFYMLSASSSALIFILLLVELNQFRPNQSWWKILTKTGQFALTLYVAHIVIGMGIMEIFGWIDSGQTLAFTLVYSFAFYGVCIIFAVLWRRRFLRGPFEALMRRITG